MPTSKYQDDGGPGILQITTLIRRISAEPEADVERFLKANIFNWLIGGTDAHAKNYSFLIDAGDAIRLAPLYDLSSQLPYPELIKQRVSMKIGEHYDIAAVSLPDWQDVARSCGVNEEQFVSLLIEMARALPDVVSVAHTQARTDGLSDKVIRPLASQLITHSEDRLKALIGPRSSGTFRRKGRLR
jgi:serine/threonine-protein kinase HipA